MENAIYKNDVWTMPSAGVKYLAHISGTDPKWKVKRDFYDNKNGEDYKFLTGKDRQQAYEIKYKDVNVVRVSVLEEDMHEITYDEMIEIAEGEDYHASTEGAASRRARETFEDFL